MKYSQWLGIAAAVALVISCTFHWTWYPDLQQYFTGFYSENNSYGKPGKAFVFFCSIAVVFYAIPRVWAKRWNILLCCIILAFAIRSFIVFSTCYRGICPEKQPGIWVMLSMAALMMLAALFPDLTIKKEEAAGASEE